VVEFSFFQRTETNFGTNIFKIFLFGMSLVQGISEGGGYGKGIGNGMMAHLIGRLGIETMQYLYNHSIQIVKDGQIINPGPWIEQHRSVQSARKGLQSCLDEIQLVLDEAKGLPFYVMSTDKAQRIETAAASAASQISKIPEGEGRDVAANLLLEMSKSPRRITLSKLETARCKVNTSLEKAFQVINTQRTYMMCGTAILTAVMIWDTFGRLHGAISEIENKMTELKKSKNVLLSWIKEDLEALDERRTTLSPEVWQNMLEDLRKKFVKSKVDLRSQLKSQLDFAKSGKIQTASTTVISTILFASTGWAWITTHRYISGWHSLLYGCTMIGNGVLIKKNVEGWKRMVIVEREICELLNQLST
jgi:hypothetical protein